MLIFLRQSTAGQEILMGPFLDDTDGKTAETALSIANTDIKIWKNGGTTESSKNSGGATHIASGRYYCVLDATDTNTLGPLDVNVHVSGALPVKVSCCVLSATIFDDLFSTGTSLTAKLANGVTHGGNTAVFQLERMLVTATTANANAVTFTGNGTGSGLATIGGATGAGSRFSGGATSGNGLAINGYNAVGFYVDSTNADGMYINGAFHGLKIVGNGINGLDISATAGIGVNIAAAGTGKEGLKITGAAASGGNAGGHAVSLVGGAATTASGGTAGRALNLVGGAGAATTNVSGIGFYVAAGANAGAGGNDAVNWAGVGAGFALNAATGGVSAAITGNITGNLSGSVGSVTGGVNVTQFGGTNGTFSGGRAEVNLTHIAGSAVNTSSAQLGVNVVNFGGAAGTFSAGRAEVNMTHIAGSSVNTSSAQLGVNVVNAAGTAWGSGAITAASIADGAIDRATFAADTGLQTIRSGTATAGAAGTITLDGSASTTANIYTPCQVVITGGTGAGQVRLGTAYSTGRVLTVVPNWTTNPDATSTFALLPNGMTNSNLTYIAGAGVATGSAQLGVNVVNWGATAVASANVRANVIQWNSSNVATPATAGHPVVTLKVGTGTGEVNVASGVVPANVMQFGGSAGTFSAGIPSVNVSQFGGSAGTFSAGIPSVNVTQAAGVSWTSGAITSAVLADGAIDRAVFAADTGLQTIRSGTAQAGGSGTITLDAGASALDGFYYGQQVRITGGTGVGQSRAITGYVGATKVASTSPAWDATPDATSTFAILPQSLTLANVLQWRSADAPTDNSGRPAVSVSHWYDPGEDSNAAVTFNGTAYPAVNMVSIDDVSLSTATNSLAAAFLSFFDVATPTLTMNYLKTKIDDIATDSSDTNTLANGLDGTLFDGSLAAVKSVTTKLDTALESDGLVYRFTTNALEQAPTGGGGGGPTAADIADEVQTRTLLANLVQIDSSTITGGSGANMAAAFVSFFDVGTPALTVASVNQTGDAYARIGANGAGLSALPWNGSWDAEVQSEAEDALNALGYTTTVSGRIDAAITSRSNIDAGDVWTYPARTVTSASNITSSGQPFSVINGNIANTIEMLFSSTISGVVSAKSFALASAPPGVDSIKGCRVVSHAAGDWEQVCVGVVASYDGSGTITLVDDFPIYPSTGDKIFILASQDHNTARMSVSSTGVVEANLVEIGDTADFVSNLNGFLEEGLINGSHLDVNVVRMLGTDLTAVNDVGAAFKSFFNVASPVLTVASVNQTGDSYARIGSTGSGLTSLAPASTALSTAVWTNTKAGYLDAAVSAVAGYIDTEVAAIKAKTDALPSSWPTNFAALSIDGSGVVSANALQISGDATAADNLEAMLDGTGGATLTLKELVCTNPDGNAITLTSLATGYAGIRIDAEGAGISAIASGATSHGLYLSGGVAGLAAIGSFGHGMTLEGSPSGQDLYFATDGLGFKASVRDAVGLASADLDLKFDDLSTSITGISDVTAKVDTALTADGLNWKFTADALQEAPTGGSAPSVADIRSEIDANSTQLAAIKAKTDLVVAAPTNWSSLAISGAGNVSADVKLWRATQPGNLDSNGFVPANAAAVNGNTTRAATFSTWLDNDRLDVDVSTLATPAQVSALLPSGFSSVSVTSNALHAHVASHATGMSPGEQVIYDYNSNPSNKLFVADGGGVYVTTIGNDAITSSALASSAVAEMQSGLSTLTAAQVRAEMDSSSTQLAAIKAKTDLVIAAPTNWSSLAISSAGNVSSDVKLWRATQPGNLDSNGFVPANTAAINGNTTRASTFSDWLDGDRLDVSVGSRLAADDYSSPPAAATIADAVWDEAGSGHTTVGTFGYYLDAQVSLSGGGGGGGATAEEIWEYADRSLSDKSGFSLSAGSVAAIAAATVSALEASFDAVLAALAPLATEANATANKEEVLEAVALISSAGDGSVSVDHNYGGVDNLRVMSDPPTSVPIAGANLTIYTAADYAAGRRQSNYVVARSVTGNDGRWRYPVLLDPDDYSLVISRAGVIVAEVNSLTVE